MPQDPLHVGIVGAGIGGLAASIAIARSGATVTLLEQASCLGEIGAGIQLFPNFSRFLIRWDVVKHLQGHLVTADQTNTWAPGPELKLIAQIIPEEIGRVCGFNWWMIRRDHLHAGLTASAKEQGVKLVIRAKVVNIEDEATSVTVTTSSGQKHSFDLLIGADGVRSTVREYLFPQIQPTAPSKVAAYRGVLPYSLIYKEIPEARHIFRNTMDFWTGHLGYVLTYPISGGQEMNVVTSFYAEEAVTQVEEVSVEEFHSYYHGYPDIIQKLLRLVERTKRWPLLQVPRMDRWSNQRRTILLIGDAAHGMHNHMGQGAATAVEDGAFLGQALSDVVRGTISLETAVMLTEDRRMPKAWLKQQASMISGHINMMDVPEGWNRQEVEKKREQSSRLEVQTSEECVTRKGSGQLPPWYRSWQLYCSPQSNKQVLFYDAEADADNAVCEYLTRTTGVDERTGVSEGLKSRFWGNVLDSGMDARKSIAVNSHGAGAPQTNGPLESGQVGSI